MQPRSHAIHSRTFQSNWPYCALGRLRPSRKQLNIETHWSSTQYRNLNPVLLTQLTVHYTFAIIIQPYRYGVRLGDSTPTNLPRIWSHFFFLFANTTKTIVTAMLAHIPVIIWEPTYSHDGCNRVDRQTIITVVTHHISTYFCNDLRAHILPRGLRPIWQTQSSWSW